MGDMLPMLLPGGLLLSCFQWSQECSFLCMRFEAFNGIPLPGRALLPCVQATAVASSVSVLGIGLLSQFVDLRCANLRREVRSLRLIGPVLCMREYHELVLLPMHRRGFLSMESTCHMFQQKALKVSTGKFSIFREICLPSFA